MSDTAQWRHNGITLLINQRKCNASTYSEEINPVEKEKQYVEVWDALLHVIVKGKIIHGLSLHFSILLWLTEFPL